MNILDLSAKIMETQGFIALLLIATLVQNHFAQRTILQKNCELTQFIMDCLKHSLEDDQDDINRDKLAVNTKLDKQRNDISNLQNRFDAKEISREVKEAFVESSTKAENGENASKHD